MRSFSTASRTSSRRSADVFINAGVPDTLILGQRGTVQDQGINTVILPFRGRSSAIQVEQAFGLQRQLSS
ncbi:MAG: hypothetical protein JOZ62_05480 [Acidobacteriaceae bacterium]|nr:hypothetical protein [Acidobacteriaceae bacterium]